MKKYLKSLAYLNIGLALVNLVLNIYLGESWLGWACATLGWSAYLSARNGLE